MLTPTVVALPAWLQNSKLNEEGKDHVVLILTLHFADFFSYNGLPERELVYCQHSSDVMERFQIPVGQSIRGGEVGKIVEGTGVYILRGSRTSLSHQCKTHIELLSIHPGHCKFMPGVRDAARVINKPEMRMQTTQAEQGAIWEHTHTHTAEPKALCEIKNEGATFQPHQCFHVGATSWSA